MNFGDWLGANIVQIIVASVGFGVLWKGQQDQRERQQEIAAQIASLARKFDEQDERTRQFWRTDWSVLKERVENHHVRIDVLEKYHGKERN